MPRTRRPRSRTVAVQFNVLMVPMALALTACDVPTFDGPQIQSPPQGFLLVPDSYLQRRMFPHHDALYQNAWVESVDDFSTIHINGHPGVLGLEDVMAAQDTARRLAQDPDVTFGEVEPLTVDGRQAWGWAERVETPTRGLVWVAYRAAIPYDTVTYAVEFYSGEPAIKRNAPDTLKAVISTFAIGRTTWNVPLLALLAGIVLFAVVGLRSRAKAKAARLQTIRLVQIKKDPEAAAADDEAAAAIGQPPAVG